MSGQPYRYSTDQEMYRTEYMKNLQERINLDDQVYQAVKGYVANGTLPAISQLPDTRSTSEKLLDIQKLKQDLIKDLMPIMDQTIASNFIQVLVQSPLNIDNKLVIFLAQNANELVKELSKKYKYGIKGDANDIYTFVEFINNAYSLTINSKSSIKSIMDSGYTKSSGMANGKDLELFFQDLMKAVGGASISNVVGLDVGEVIGAENILEGIREKINFLEGMLPTDDEFKRLEGYLTRSDNALNSEIQEAIILLFAWMKITLPNKQYIIALSNNVSGPITYALKNRTTYKGSDLLKSLQVIYDLLPKLEYGLPMTIREIIEFIDNEEGGGRGNDGSLSGSSGPSSSISSNGSSGDIDKRLADYQRRLDALREEDPRPDPNLDDLQARFDALKSNPSSTSPQQTSSILDALEARFNALRLSMVPPHLQNLPQVGYANPLFQPDTSQTGPADPITQFSTSQTSRKPGQPDDVFTSTKMGSTKPVRGPQKETKILGAPPPGMDDVQEEEWLDTLTKTQLEDHLRYLKKYEKDATDKQFRVDVIIRMKRKGGHTEQNALRPPEATPTPTRKGDRSMDKGEMKELGHMTDNKIQGLLEERRDMFRHYHKKFNEPDIKSPQMLQRSQDLAIGRSNDALEKQGFDMSLLDKIDKATFSGLQGEGIGKRRGRPKGTGFKQNIENHIDTQKGIQPDYRFSKFGKYLIRNDHLMDNTVSIRTGKGMNITGLPSTKTNPNVINIIKKIIGGTLPSFSEMSKLTEPEKEYLHKISKKSNILEKINIPTPSKDKEEKDLHEFEVMKGEIMAGNDNKDMIRKFKGLILKFSKAGTLPKQQVNEILSDLLDLGY